jgi:ankyrin repeat protein/L-ascorbate metabolism protein UlaG (beta-lactamase superfamily)
MRTLFLTCILFVVISTFVTAGEIHEAIRQNDLAQVTTLLTSNPDLIKTTDSIGRSPLHVACGKGNLEMVDLLLSKGADPNIRNTISGGVPLNISVINGFEEVVKRLLAKGANVNIANNAGYTPLINSAMSGNVNITTLLLDAGADMNAKTGDGRNPLLWAFASRQVDIAKLLISRGSSTSVTDNQGEDIFNYSLQVADTALANIAISAGFDVKSKDNWNFPRFLRAVNSGNPDLIKMFIQLGADINSVDMLGYPAIQNAIVFGSSEVTSLLVENGANTDFIDSHTGASLLHLAVFGGTKEKVDALLTKITEVNPIDNDGCTPLYYAEKHNHPQIAELLKSKGGISKGPKTNPDLSAWITQQPAEKEAIFWYLMNCGYAVRTKNHLLIFDYMPASANATNPSLANGFVNPAELKNLDVTVFATHQHSDHFSSVIFGWKDSIPKLTYVFGFQPESLSRWESQGYSNQPYEFVGPGTSKIIDGMNIYAIQANDAGAAFVVQVDGVTIFHGGDHAGWLENAKEGFTSQIDSVAAKFPTIDVALLNATGCHVRDTITLAEGCSYAIGKLSPKVMIPTHVMGNEYYLIDFVNKMKPQHPYTIYYSPKIKGDACLFDGTGKQAKIELL